MRPKMTSGPGGPGNARHAHAVASGFVGSRFLHRVGPPNKAGPQVPRWNLAAWTRSWRERWGQHHQRRKRRSRAAGDGQFLTTPPRSRRAIAGILGDVPADSRSGPGICVEGGEAEQLEQPGAHDRALAARASRWAPSGRGRTRSVHDLRNPSGGGGGGGGVGLPLRPYSITVVQTLLMEVPCAGRGAGSGQGSRRRREISSHRGEVSDPPSVGRPTFRL